MGVLRRATLRAVGALGASALVGAAGGCYSPDLADCVTRCTKAADCAPDQVCGDDRRCAAPEVADQCDQLLEPDARDGADAPPGDPDARPDAASATMLRVEVGGGGRVKVEMPVDENCDGDDEAGAVCTYAVSLGVNVRLRAQRQGDWSFTAWTGTCTPMPPDNCLVVIGPGTTTAGATFDED
jgi:hypothetical protein